MFLILCLLSGPEQVTDQTQDDRKVAIIVAVRMIRERHDLRPYCFRFRDMTSRVKGNGDIEIKGMIHDVDGGDRYPFEITLYRKGEKWEWCNMTMQYRSLPK